MITHAIGCRRWLLETGCVGRWRMRQTASGCLFFRSGTGKMDAFYDRLMSGLMRKWQELSNCARYGIVCFLCSELEVFPSPSQFFVGRACSRRPYFEFPHGYYSPSQQNLDRGRPANLYGPALYHGSPKPPSPMLVSSMKQLHVSSAPLYLPISYNSRQLI